MGIWSRLGGVINSYITDFAEETNSRLKSDNRARTHGDLDLDAAYDELNDYLNGKKADSGRGSGTFSSGAFSGGHASKKGEAFSGKKLPPEELRADFEYLGVPFGTDEQTCKTAYKKLLKTHHPDRHAGHDGNYKKATEKTSKINAAYDRIEKWRNG